MTLIGSTITSEQVGQSNSPSENYLFLNVMVNFVIVNQKMTGSALHIEKNQTIRCMNMIILYVLEMGRWPTSIKLCFVMLC